jgi:hypothetical protein
MSAREQPDSVEWMRQRWLEHHAPKALLVHPTTVTADLRKVREALGDLG